MKAKLSNRTAAAEIAAFHLQRSGQPRLAADVRALIRSAKALSQAQTRTSADLAQLRKGARVMP